MSRKKGRGQRRVFFTKAFVQPCRYNYQTAVKKANLPKGWDAKPPAPFLWGSGVAQPMLNASAHSFVRRMGFFFKEVKQCLQM
jgi:hypothetical protein